jgi:hypothetical protein
MADRDMLTASFVRTVGERDRIYVTRTDGTTVDWVMTSYGDDLPHDLVHLVVESAFGLRQGFWGRVNGGADPGAISREANRKGGRDKYAAYGADQAELQLAEALANARWLDDAPVATLAEQAAAQCRQLGVAAPSEVSVRHAEQLRAVLQYLTARWRGLRPKGAIVVAFDPSDPARGFARLANDTAA